ncbi:hypothetical protein TrCOL_g4738 [Triparma columacea]|uniref:Ubiquitin-like domain-containing protein n=1 Tax=Triparma columacea TaxID=722753 RepID=A0A9W7L615_9STRA|nr:hypothetical protein TrCOL_g4738 [Triparma columacea]
MEAKIDDGDDTFIEVSNSSAALGRSPAKAPGLSLNLGREGGRVDADEKDTSAEGVMTRQLETQVMVVFELPDGSTVEEEFRMGQSVEVLKSFLASELGIPMETQSLYLNDTLMFDPLSLMDFKDIDPSGSDDVYIRVEGDMDGGDVGRK